MNKCRRTNSLYYCSFMKKILNSIFLNAVPLCSFIISLTIINLIGCYFVHRFPLRYEAIVLADIILMAACLSCIKESVRRWLEWIFVGIYFVIDIVEAFISYKFNLDYCCDSLSLLFETNPGEAAGFLKEYVFTINNIGFYLCYLLVVVLIIISFYYRKHIENQFKNLRYKSFGGGICLLSLVVALCIQVNNLSFRVHVFRTMTENGDQFYDRYWVGRYNSIARLAIAIKQADKSKHDSETCLQVTSQAVIDGCDNTSPIIVFCIGESYVKRHSQLYGYTLETTPNVMREKENGNLFVFTDVITPFNITSTTFKNMFSLHGVDEPDNWCDKPLFPKLFRLAGYKTSFISNQYIGRPLGSEECVIGDFFMDNEKIRKQLFDYANTEQYKYDEQLFPLFDQALETNSRQALIILHGIGLHAPFSWRYPQTYRHFSKDNYQHRRELSTSEKQLVADYDNAVCYQDSLNGVMFDRLRSKESIVIFVPDHGEEVLDFNHLQGRNHNSYQKDIVKSENEVPMWIWCSPVYIEKHPAIIDAIKSSVSRPYTNTDISHLLLDLAGIKCSYFDPTRSIINAKFNDSRKRFVMSPEHDYDQIMHN